MKNEPFSTPSAMFFLLAFLLISYLIPSTVIYSGVASRMLPIMIEL